MTGKEHHFGEWFDALSFRLKEWVAAFDQLPADIQSAQRTLGESGWYMDCQLPAAALWRLEEMLQAGENHRVDALLIQHYEQRLDEIESNLIQSLPKRGSILRAAFAAHRRGEFELSVPVLLAQSDGASLDLTDYHFFMKPETSQYVTEAALDEVAKAMLEPLATSLPIRANKAKREARIQAHNLPNWRELNRHLVLHGESCDYGIQMNSLKAVSLLNFLVCVLAATQGRTLVPTNADNDCGLHNSADRLGKRGDKDNPAR